MAPIGYLGIVLLILALLLGYGAQVWIGFAFGALLCLILAVLCAAALPPQRRHRRY